MASGGSQHENNRRNSKLIHYEIDRTDKHKKSRSIGALQMVLAKEVKINIKEGMDSRI